MVTAQVHVSGGAVVVAQVCVQLEVPVEGSLPEGQRPHLLFLQLSGVVD